jgi:hypothetical protein
MVKIVNLTSSNCSIDSLCTILGPGESLEFMLSEQEMMLAHPDIVEFIKRGHLAVVPSQQSNDAHDSDKSVDDKLAPADNGDAYKTDGLSEEG